MKTSFSTCCLLMALSVGLNSCKGDSASAAADAKEKQDEVLKNLDKSLEGLKENNSEIVDFRILMEALPEKIVGLPRVSHDGNTSGIGGLSFSLAEAAYAEGDKKITIAIMDTGGLAGTLASIAAWTQLEVDKESADGYERTTLIEGKKAYEKYDRKNKYGEISLISADRFVVTVAGANIDEDDLRTALSKINIKK